MPESSTNDYVEQNRQSYNKIAEKWSLSRKYVWPDLLIFKNYLKNGQKVLDLGCGNGRLVELFNDFDVDYLGVDYSENLIAQAKNNFPSKKFEVQDALDLNFEHGQFDVVLCTAVLNHIPKNQQKTFIENIRKVLKPGGILLLSNWSLWNVKSKKSVWKSKVTKFRDVLTKWKSGDEEVDLYYYAWTKKQVNKILASHNFKVEKNYYSKLGKSTILPLAENIITIAKNNHPSLIKKKSNIHGYGIFTDKNLAKGENFYDIPLTNLHYKNNKRFAYIGNDQYVCDLTVLNWVNHSCEPNSYLDLSGIKPCLVALEDIKVGSEIVCNYNFSEKEGVYRHCKCGSKMCKSDFGKKK